MRERSINDLAKDLMKMRDAYRNEVEKVLPENVANDAVNIWVGNFDRSGFDKGNGTDPWDEVKRHMGPGTEGGGQKGTPEWRWPKTRKLSRRTSAILVRTGGLRRAVSGSKRAPTVTARRITLNFALSKEYGFYHNSGTKNDGGHLPKRQFIGTSLKLKAMVNQRMEESVNRISNSIA